LKIALAATLVAREFERLSVNLAKMKPEHQHWNAAKYARNARFVSDLGMPVLELLAPRSGERILDLGCGDGALTLKLQQSGCTVTAVDASDDMVQAASQLGLDARVVDCERLSFTNEFDAVFSNAALHWMLSANDVVAGVARALKPGGRFVAEFGGYGNVATVTAAVNEALASRQLKIDHPWFFPAPDIYQDMLESNGFNVQHIELFPRLTPLPGEISAWLETFYKPFLSAVPESEWAMFVADVCTQLEPNLLDDSGIWHVDYVRLRFAAIKVA
jgi:trans-aconitate methyltransferase